MSLIGSEKVISIFPEIECSAQCPCDGSDLQLLGVVIPGMRCLVEAMCPSCEHEYYVDLPVGQAIWSPMIINRNSGEVNDVWEHDPSVSFEWFRQSLQQGFLKQETDNIVPIVHSFYESQRIIIVNCLDFLYGHSLLKLLNVQRYLEHAPELGCCVLVPTQLRHLVPDGVAEIWELPVKIQHGRKWYPSLQRWISQKLTHYQECFLSPAYSHPSNNVYDLRRFVKNLPDVSGHIGHRRPVIMFSYREDRLWGNTPRQQQRNIRVLYQQLVAIFPDMVFVIIGFDGDRELLPQNDAVIDLRVGHFDIEQDRLWLAYMSITDCVIGLHGSNMLLPSGFAASVVELVPRSRLGNTGQDFLFRSNLREARDALLLYRMIYGNEVLSNISPTTVTDVVANILSYARLNVVWFQEGEHKKDSDRMEWENICHETVFKQATAFLSSKPQRSIGRRFKDYIENLLLQE